MAMKAQLLEELKEIATFPVYLYLRSPTGFICEKFTWVEKKAFDRKKYFIAGKVQCSCIGWMKTQSCKHLKMLNGDFSWATPGVPASYAEAEAVRILKILSEKNENFQKLPSLDLAKIPSNVLELALPIYVERNSPLERVSFIREVVSGLKMGVSFIATVKPE